MESGKPTTPTMKEEIEALRNKIAEQKKSDQKKFIEDEQANQRKILAQRYANLDEAAERYAIAALHHEKFSKGKNVTKTYDEQKMLDEMELQRQSGGGIVAKVATDASILGNREEGIWTFKGFDIRFKDGYASFMKPPGDYKVLIDFLRESTGGDTLYIDFDSVDQVNESQLKKLIAYAKERDLYVEFGDNVKKYFDRGQYNEAQPFFKSEPHGLIGWKYFDPKKKWQEYTGYKLDAKLNADAKNAERKKDDKFQQKIEEGKDKILYDRAAKELKSDKSKIDLEKLKKELETLSPQEKQDKLKSTLDKASDDLFRLQTAQNELKDNTEEHLKNLAEHDVSSANFKVLESIVKETHPESAALLDAIGKKQTELKDLMLVCNGNLEKPSKQVEDLIKQRGELKQEANALVKIEEKIYKELDPVRRDQIKNDNGYEDKKKNFRDREEKYYESEKKLSTTEKRTLDANENLEKIKENLSTLERAFTDLRDKVNTLPKQVDDKKTAHLPKPT